MDKFQVGDWAQPLAFDDTAPPFEVKEIFSDGFGRVLLSEPGGYGYGEHYCVKVDAPSKDEDETPRWSPSPTSPVHRIFPSIDPSILPRYEEKNDD